MDRIKSSAYHVGVAVLWVIMAVMTAHAFGGNTVANARVSVSK